jgi:heavy metal sensor kinase
MTIRMRLTLLFSILFALLLVVVRFTSYNVMDEILTQYFRGRLNERAKIAATIALHSNELSEKAAAAFMSELDMPLRFERIGVYDNNISPVFYHGLPFHRISRDIKEQVFTKGRFESDENDTQYVYIRYINEGRPYIVAIGAYNGRRAEIQHQFGTYLIISSSISLVFIFALGWWFSARALKPIRIIMEHARRISATDLDVRLNEGNGRDELALLSRAFNDMFDRLKETFDSQKQFIANASHELRTPLTTLEGYLDVTLMKPRTELQYETILHAALDETRHIQRVMNQLLLLARADSEFKDAPMSSIRIDEVMFTVLDEIHKRFPTRKIDINFDVFPERGNELLINGNPELLQIAFINVIENAMKYSPHNAPVSIGMLIEAEHIDIVVRDKGMGIHENDSQKIFQPFFRSDEAREVYGHGIGLALVQSIVNHHRGTIRVDSIKGVETTFTLSFPCDRN